MNNQLRSSKQAAASRANGSKSKGPVSDSGKAKSSQNAIKHGLRSSRVVLANESQEKYDQMLAAYRREWKPVGVTENALVVQIVNARWRIRRIESIETAILDSRMFQLMPGFENAFTSSHAAMRHADAVRAIALSNPNLLDYIERAETRLTRSVDRALSQLTRLQTLRLGHAPVLDTDPLDAETNEPDDETANYENPETFAWTSRFVPPKERPAGARDVAPEPERLLKRRPAA